MGSDSNKTAPSFNEIVMEKHNLQFEFHDRFLRSTVEAGLHTVCVCSFQIGINPGMFAAFKGHHYAGPGNHFCAYFQ